MLTAQQIVEMFEALNVELATHGETAEIGIVGGAVMCLVFKTRAATRDVDAIFEPADVVRKAAARVADEHGLPVDWLNDAVKAFIQGDFTRHDVVNLSNLRVWAPEARYMLAMKCISARWDTSDRDDVMFLIRHLALGRAQDVFEIIEHYYPRKQIAPKTQFFIEELFGD